MTLKTDYPDSPDPEASCFKDHCAWGEKYIEEFYKLKPKKLNEYQEQILLIFYKCRNYSDEMKRIPLDILEKFCNVDICDSDICEYIVKGIDSEFLRLSSEKIKNDTSKIRQGK